ncbi:MAG: LysR family transcriptional regulator [Burkholderiales bacterium]
MDALHPISVFVKVAEARSFTAAAKRLGLSPSAASKSLTRLEQRLGVRLLNRTTRTVSLTDDGSAFYERCRLILSELEDAESAVTREQSEPRGRLRVVTPAGFGRAVLIPVLTRFAARHRELTLDVEFSSRVVDIAEEGVDVLVHIGALSDRRLVARKLCQMRYVTVAAPEYLERCGEPKHPADLARHECLGHHIPYTNRYRDWAFAHAGERIAKTFSGNLNLDDGSALLAAAIEGAGIAMVATFLAAEPVRSGRLKIVLRDYIADGPEVWIAYLDRRHLPRRIREFVSFVAAHVPQSVSTDDQKVAVPRMA